MVIAPTRAACETIELAVGLTGIETVLEREHGERIRRLAASGVGFGVVAGTGTGKTLGIRLIAEEVVGLPLRIGVVNREREATPETPECNVVIVTTGIARRWLQDDLISGEDTLVVDEIHQTSAELELCLALAKRVGCRFVWLSATVDPAFYAEYLHSAEVIQASAVDPTRAARVRVIPSLDVLDFLGDRFLRRVVKERRGVAAFVPTRAEAEAVAGTVTEGPWQEAIHGVFYHGGEPISVLRPFLEGDPPRPYLLSMTAAGQSALNVRGLDTVVILDAQFTSVVQRGKPVLTRLPLGSNEILQMAGRVHGRVAGSEVWILSERDVRFDELVPEPPRFQLAGDPEQVALACARVGVRADDLELPVPLDRMAYRRALENLERRGIVERGRLTDYGARVEVLPVDRPWAELLVHAPEHLLPVVAVAASADNLHRMIRPGTQLRDLAVPGSDHLTTYNIYADALHTCGALGQVFGLPRHVFDHEALFEWAESRGTQPRAIEDTALALASILRALDVSLPGSLPPLSRGIIREWQELVARVMPFDLIMDGETAWGEPVRASMSSMCGPYNAIAGQIRYFSDPRGRARASIEGTELSYNLVRRSATGGAGEIVYDPAHPRSPLRLRQTLSYHGFVLDRDDTPVAGFPPGREDEARRVLAEAMAAGATIHRATRHNRGVIGELREVHRRSGGATPPLDEASLAGWFAERLAAVDSYEGFLDTDLRLSSGEWVPEGERARWLALPDTVEIAGDEYPADYALDGGVGVIRARVPSYVVRKLREEDLPELDRPLHWTVIRGKRSAIRAASLAEAQARLDEREAEPATGEDGGLRREPSSPPERSGARRPTNRARRRVDPEPDRPRAPRGDPDQERGPRGGGGPRRGGRPRRGGKPGPPRRGRR